MVNKLKLLAAAPLVIGLLGFASFTAFADTTPAATTAEIDVVVTNYSVSGTTVSSAAVSGLTATVKDASGNSISPTINNGVKTPGTYAISGLTAKGDYYITLTNTAGSITETVKGTVSAFSTTKDVIVNANWLTASTAPTKVGALGGLLLDSTSVATGAVVEAYNSAGVLWTTTTDANGEYKFYLAPGTYTLVTPGVTVSGVSAESTKSSVKVVAGCTTGPMSDQTEGTLTNNAAAFGYTAPTTFTGKTLTGAATAGDTVAVYKYVAATTGSTATPAVYTLLAKPVVASKTNAFSISLSNYLAGESIAIKVTDPALNVFEDTATAGFTVAARTMTVTPESSTATTGAIATITTPVVLTYADSVSTMTSYLTSNITSLVVTYTTTSVTTPAAMTLVSGTDYKIASGKITFTAGVLNDITKTYHVTLNAAGYGSITATQNVAPSAIAATSISGTFTPTAGTTAGSTSIITSNVTVPTGDMLVYEVVASTVKAQFKGNAISGAAGTVYSTFTAGSANVISGVSSTSNCVDVYLVSGTTATTGANVIIGYHRVALTSTQMTKAVSASASAITTVTGATTITLGSAISGLATSNIVVKNGTTTLTASTDYTLGSLSGATFTITFKSSAALTSSSTVTVTITKTGCIVNSGSPVAVDVTGIVLPATGVAGSLGTITQGSAGGSATSAKAQLEAASGDTLSIADPSGVYNGITVTISQNLDDTLAVTCTSATALNIALADTSPAKNTGTIIQDAIRALGTVHGVNFSGWTAVSAGDWDTVTIGATFATSNTTTMGGFAAVAGATETVGCTISAGATAAGTVKVTVNGTAHNVTVTAGETATAVATAIKTQLTTDGVTGYTVTNTTAGVVTFTSTSANTSVTDITVVIAG